MRQIQQTTVDQVRALFTGLCNALDESVTTGIGCRLCGNLVTLPAAGQVAVTAMVRNYREQLELLLPSCQADLTSDEVIPHITNDGSSNGLLGIRPTGPGGAQGPDDG